MPPISFNSNIASIGVTRHLTASTRDLQRNFERLSTGLRINRASDDAAGLAIADRLKVDSRLYTAASRNVNDGISLANIMGSTITEQSNIVQRLIELAEQSANGTLGNSQRNALNQEFRSLADEFGRLGDTTKFNGISLLLGGRGSNPSQIGLQGGITGGSNSQLQLLTLDVGTLSGNFSVGIGGTSAITSVTTEQLATSFSNNLLSVSVTDSSGVRRDLMIGLEFDFASPGIAGYYVDVYQRVRDTGGVGASTGFATVDSASDDWVLGGQGNMTVDATTGKVTGGFASPVPLTFLGGATASPSFDLRGMTFSDNVALDPNTFINKVSTSLELTGVETKNRSLHALTILRSRLSNLAEFQGSIGAVLSRLETVSSLVHSSREQTASAESRIRDVDVAEESAALARERIRQQSALPVLSLANRQPELLLSLLS